MGDYKDRKTLSNEAEKKKIAFTEQVKKQEITVKDKSIASETAGALHQDGTKDGAARVKKAMEGAGKAIDTQMDKQAKEHDNISKEGQREEKVLDQSAKAAESDSKKAGKAAGDVKTPEGKAALNEASKAAEEDKSWLKNKEKEREEKRKESEKTTKGQQSTVKSTRVVTKR